MKKDLVFAVRMLLKSPAITCIAILAGTGSPRVHWEALRYRTQGPKQDGHQTWRTGALPAGEVLVA